MQIQHRIKKNEYAHANELISDVHLLVESLKHFYKSNSQEYRDVCSFWELLSESKSHLGDLTDDTSETSNRSRESSPSQSCRSLRSNSPSRSFKSSDASPSMLSSSGSDPVPSYFLEQLIAFILLYKDETGRIISQAFKLLPSEQEYPDYYVSVKNPIDLKIIARRIRSNRYRSLNDLEREINLMCRNAKLYNERA
ncbi:unnamed protein product, partial [Soboliphyme baturini]|uniref:Bromo domain-containing protein n=1 Tax=Soboliphyme baturini TaxID=241478 RepID=A0A183I9H4_9BILA